MSLYLINRKQTLKQQILDLAEKAGYIVRVSKISSGDDGGKVLTLFPSRKFGHPVFENEELVHEISKQETSFRVKRHDKNKWRTFNLPDYVVRPFIMQDIYIKCGFLGIDQDLVIGYDENNIKVKKLIDAIPEPLGVDRAKEISCATLFLKKILGYQVDNDPNFKSVETGITFIEKFIKDSSEKFLNEEILE